MNIRRLRHVTQSISFLLSNLGFNLTLKTGIVYPFLHCYGCPLASGACPIGTLQNFIILLRALPILPMCPFYLLGILGVYGVVFGRAFCGWACPFGAFQDLLALLGRKKRKLRPFTYSKFIMLGLVIVLAWVTLDTVFCKYCPAGSLFAALPAPFFAALQLPFFPVDWKWTFYFNVHIATLILTTVLVLFFSRFWCRYLCPFATIGIFNRISIMTITHTSAKCTNCLKCLDECPMGIDKVESIGKSSDCIMCGKCVEVCPTKHLEMRARR